MLCSDGHRVRDWSCQQTDESNGAGGGAALPGLLQRLRSELQKVCAPTSHVPNSENTLNREHVQYTCMPEPSRHAVLTLFAPTLVLAVWSCEGDAIGRAHSQHLEIR